MAFIPDKIYQQIVDIIPICCIDGVVVQNGKVLLVKRKQDPENGKWWFPGGRLLKHETLQQAVIRKVKEEVGIDVEIIRKIDVYDYRNDRTSFEDVTSGIHAISVNFVVKPIDSTVEISLDDTSSEFRWIDYMEQNLDPYVKKVIDDSGVFE